MGSDDDQKHGPTETTPAPPTIAYKPFEEARLNEVITLLVDNFFPYNNLWKALRPLEGGQPEENRGWIAAILATWSWEGCLVAVDAASDRVVGVSISVVTEPDSPGPFKPLLEGGTEVAKLFTQLVHELVGDYDVFTALGVKRVFYRIMTAVDVGYQRQGIAGELFRRTTHEAAPAAGCEAVIGVSVSNFTERCWRKLHYQEVGRVRYEESAAFAANPRVELSRCGEHRSTTLMVLKL